MNNLILSTRNIDTVIDEIVSKVVSQITFPQLQPIQSQDELLTVPQAADFLSLSVPTVYGLIHKAVIPHMKRGKRVYFSRADLMKYIQAGRVKTQEDFANDADAYLSEKRKGGRL